MTENENTEWSKPEFQVLYAPPSYGELIAENQGAYKFVWEDGSPVGIVWTDFDRGAGLLVGDTTTATSKRVLGFLTDMASVEFPVTQAYTLIDTKAATTDERTGPLQDALDAIDDFLTKGTVPDEKEEDFDD